MPNKHTVGALVLAAALSLHAGVPAHGEDLYPDWSGQWSRLGSGAWDPSKRGGPLQQGAPLTPEYQAILKAGVADVAAGGHGNNPTPTCIPPGMPRAMLPYETMEFVITPQTTYVLIEFMNQLRRIYTDGRDWPAHVTPSFLGTSLGHWDDIDGDGRYDTLTVETRGLKGPRTFDGMIPLHRDNETVVRERIFRDRTDAHVIHNEITTIDHALTQPWTVTRSYQKEAQAIWFEYPCGENNEHVFIGKENYLLSADGDLMPARKDQQPPDLRNFTPTPK